MQQMDCTIVGAGAAGLMAALTLAKAGRSVRLLEASQRLGGRIHTLHPTGFSTRVEAGAEFVHGQLPITLQLLQEANITYVPVAGSSWQKKPGGWQKQDDETDSWEQVIQQMQTLETDMTLADFLFEYFPGDDQVTLRDEVQRFAEGFDLADIFTASVFALRDEWNSEATEEYRLPGGYSQLIDHLAQQCRNLGVEILTGCRISRVAIGKQNVEMQSADGRSFEADKAIIAISLGLLQRSADDDDNSTGLSFTPAIPEYLKAFREMGYGSVVKLAMEFKDPFWEQQSSDVGFILSQEQIPTWWTQLSVKNNLLTGWLGGPVASSMQYTNRQVVYTQAMESLSRIFEKPVEELEEKLVAWEIFNWSADLFAAGAYSYGTLPAAAALQTVMQPVAGRLWFAGEAIYDGSHPGTVEAALESGSTVAGKLL